MPDKNSTTVTRIGAALKRIPVRHTCGHYELRLTRWNAFNPSTTEDPANADGFLRAGSQCTQCAPQGRPVSPHFDTLAEAQAAAAQVEGGR